MKNYQGLTLLELLITITIGAILVTVAVPGFNSMTMNNRMTSYVNGFVTSLNLTRSEAIKRGVNVTICKSKTPNIASPCGPNDNTWGWNEGWVIFSDSDDNGTINGTDELIRVHEGLNSNYTIFANSAGKNTIKYGSTGFLNSTRKSLVLCDSRGFGDDAKVIVINRSGRPYVISATDSDVTVTDCDATPKP